MKRIDITNNYYVEIKHDIESYHETYYFNGKEHLFFLDYRDKTKMIQKVIEYDGKIFELGHYDNYDDIRRYDDGNNTYDCSMVIKLIDDDRHCKYVLDIDHDIYHSYYKPSSIYKGSQSTTTSYIQFGINHRIGGPATETNYTAYNHKWYSYCGLSHREDGPAWIQNNSEEHYYIYDIKVTKQEHFCYMLNKLLPENIIISYKDGFYDLDMTTYILSFNEKDLDLLEEQIKKYI